MGGWGSGWMILFGALLLAGLVVLIVLLVRVLGGGIRQSPAVPPSGGPVPDPGPVRAKQLLQERYARGEIDIDEYRDRLRNLEES